MLFRFNDLGQVFGYNRIYLISLLNKVFRPPLSYEAMGGGQMIICSSVAVGPHIPGVNSNTFEAAVNLNLGGSVEQFNLLSNVLKGDTVIVFIGAKADVVILHHRYYQLLFELVPVNGQWLQCRLLYFFKLFAAAVTAMSETGVIMVF